MVEFKLLPDGIVIQASDLLGPQARIVLDAFDIDELKKMINIFEAGDSIE